MQKTKSNLLTNYNVTIRREYGEQGGGLEYIHCQVHGGRASIRRIQKGKLSNTLVKGVLHFIISILGIRYPTLRTGFQGINCKSLFVSGYQESSEARVERTLSSQWREQTAVGEKFTTEISGDRSAKMSPHQSTSLLDLVDRKPSESPRQNPPESLRSRRTIGSKKNDHSCDNK